MSNARCRCSSQCNDIDYKARWAKKSHQLVRILLKGYGIADRSFIRHRSRIFSMFDRKLADDVVHQMIKDNAKSLDTVITTNLPIIYLVVY